MSRKHLLPCTLQPKFQVKYQKYLIQCRQIPVGTKTKDKKKQKIASAIPAGTKKGLKQKRKKMQTKNARAVPAGIRKGLKQKRKKATNV